MRFGWSAAVAAVLLAGCTASTGTASTSPTPPAPSTRTSTITGTRTVTPAPPTFTPAPATTVAPLPPGAAPPAGERERRCPYVASARVQSIIGSHVYRTTVLTRLRPVGCRFYFYSGAYEAIADIVPRRFASAQDAYNAMVLTAQAGTQAEGRKNLVAGVDAVLYRTRFFGEDGPRDWACVFAADRTMVIVHSQQTDTSLDALLLARAVAGRF